MNPKKEAILRKVLEFLTSPAAASKRLTLSKLAEAMDMGKSTLYEYFDNKDVMIQQAILLMMSDHVAILLSGEDFPDLSFDEAFEQHMTRSFTIAEKNQMIQQVIESVDVIALDPALKQGLMESMYAFYEQLRQRMQAILAKGVAEKVLKPLDNTLRLATIDSMFLGALVSWSNPMFNFDRDDLIGALKESLVLLHR
ncbi:MAG: TetR/AcrR family transcriptional regulator [Acholeplasmatales bacterium]|nr:MAG: TetR/AcrR family transcriptional regulator [Acholeplasmatales bacterium]